MDAYVKDIMSTGVIVADPAACYTDLAALLRRHRISGFPVVDDDRVVVGVVSESDLLARQAAAGPRQIDLGGLTAAELMTRPAVTVGPDEPAAHAARLMHSRKRRRLPVVDDGDRLLGIVTRIDVLSTYTRPDEEIRREINQDVIADGFFTDPDRLGVTVKDGIVTLAGTPGSVVLGRNIAGQVRHVEGVLAVRDRFTYRPKTEGPRPRQLGSASPCWRVSSQMAASVGSSM
jgi:CBS domain-containing protein